MSKKFLDFCAEIAGKIDPHRTAPNPRVGAVAAKNGKILAAAAHEKFGGPHAEILLFEKLKNFDFCGAKIFISLEPCDDFPGKKTKSCTNFLIKKLKNKNAKIFVGALDPFFGGKNLEKIRAAGIFCEFLKNENCEKLNPFFKKFAEKKMPFLNLKIAQNLTGKIFDPRKKWISNEISRQKVHEFRANFSAILTTTATILADNPRFDARPQNFSRAFSDPKILIFGEKKIPRNFKIFEKNFRAFDFFGAEKKLIFEKIDAENFENRAKKNLKFKKIRAEKFAKKNFEKLASEKFGKFGSNFCEKNILNFEICGKKNLTPREIYFFSGKNLRADFAKIRAEKIDSILTECGGKMNSAILAENLADEISLFLAPKIFPAAKNSFVKNLELKNFSLQKCENLGGDIFLNFQKK